MVLQPEHSNIAVAALLYMAEKYRLIVALADRFDDGGISDAAASTQRAATRLSLTLTHTGIETREDAERIGVALAGYSENTNRLMQKLTQQGMVQDAALLEHNLRQMYAVVAAVEAVAASLAQGTPAGAAAD